MKLNNPGLFLVSFLSLSFFLSSSDIFYKPEWLQNYFIWKQIKQDTLVGGKIVAKRVKVKSSHLYLYRAFNNTNCNKATAQYQNRKIVYQ